MKPLTTYEREIVAKTFKKAKALFEQGHCTYICTALGWTLPHGVPGESEEYLACKLTKAIVMERLEGQLSLESWLKKQGFFFPRNPTPELEQKLRNHRLQWLNLLIAEFEGVKS